MGAKKRGDIKEICQLVSPKHGLLTSIGEQHLETFKTIENTKKTKHELIDALPEDGMAFENIDDENIRSIPRLKNRKYILYGIDASEAMYAAKDIKFNAKGSTFTVVKYDNTQHTFNTKLLGKHNIYNILGCIAIASELGMSMEQISYAVKELETVEHRLSVKKTSNNITIIDDAYNSNPVGANMALDVLNIIEGKQKILITPGIIELGSKHYEINKRFGESAAHKCDYIILVGKKRTQPIYEGLINKGFPAEKIYSDKDLDEALKHMNTIVNEGDVVLFENDLPDNFNE
jgi:UDP-N-acetylmuramoyl-tripeptide--D-alanyl-D-alanine ligase